MTTENGSERANVGLAWLLVICASLSTMLGTTVMFCMKNKALNRKTIASLLGLSSGVMVYVCVAELSSKSEEHFMLDNHSPETAKVLTTVSFFCGAIFMYIIDFFVHCCGGGHGPEADLAQIDKIFDDQNVDRTHVQEDEEVKIHTDADQTVTGMTTTSSHSTRSAGGKNYSNINKASSNSDELDSRTMYKLGLKTVLAIVLHNFPEGLASFLATIADGRTGVGITFGIIMHNIPEGLCVSAPIYYATKSKLQTFMWTFTAGFAELLGGFCGWIMAGSNISGSTYGAMFGVVNGLVTFISVTEFVPMAAKIDPTHTNRWFVTSFLIGCMGIAITLVGEQY